MKLNSYAACVLLSSLLLVPAACDGDGDESSESDLPESTPWCDGADNPCITIDGEERCCSDDMPYICVEPGLVTCINPGSVDEEGCGRCIDGVVRYCLSCSELLADLSLDVDRLCEESKPILEAYLSCLCAPCAAVCGALCENSTPECVSCLEGSSTTSACDAEIAACWED